MTISQVLILLVMVLFVSFTQWSNFQISADIKRVQSHNYSKTSQQPLMYKQFLISDSLQQLVIIPPKNKDQNWTW